jgi:histidinol dehydrogenase
MPTYLKKAMSPDSQINGSTEGKNSSTTVRDTVTQVIQDIRENGDVSVRLYSEKFDSWSPQQFKLSQSEIDAIIGEVPEQTLQDIKEVQNNVRKFAQAQRQSLTDFELETTPGVFLGQKNLPINRVGA